MSCADRPKKEKWEEEMSNKYDDFIEDFINSLTWTGSRAYNTKEETYQLLEELFKKAKGEARLEGARAMYCALSQGSDEVNGHFEIKGNYLLLKGGKGKLNDIEKEVFSDLKEGK